MKPSVARNVHYYDHVDGSGPFAAIVTRVVDDNTIDLFVMTPDKAYHVSHVYRDESPTPHPKTWRWPPRV